MESGAKHGIKTATGLLELSKEKSGLKAPLNA